jgi:hypothetical protein
VADVALGAYRKIGSAGIRRKPAGSQPQSPPNARNSERSPCRTALMTKSCETLVYLRSQSGRICAYVKYDIP